MYGRGGAGQVGADWWRAGCRGSTEILWVLGHLLVEERVRNYC